MAIIDHGEIIENANVKTLINRLNTQTIILDLKDSMTETTLDGYSHQLVDENNFGN